MNRTAIAFLLLPAACASGPRCTPEQLAEIRTFQAALTRELARPEAELFEPGLLFEIPEGWKIYDLDLHGRTGAGLCVIDGERHPAFLLHDGRTLRAVSWDEGHSVPDPRHGEIYRFVDREPDGGWFLVAAGQVLGGFDSIDRFALRDDVGATLVTTRDGAQWIIVGDRVFTRWAFDSTLAPALSRDGTWMAYVRRSMFSETLVLSPADSPESIRELTVEGQLDWPIDLSGDGLHWAASSTAGAERLAILDGEVLGRFDEVLGPITADGAFVPVWKVRQRDRSALYIGRERTPWYEDVGWPVRSADGRVLAFVARDGEHTHVHVDGDVVLSHPQVVGLGLAPSGKSAAVATREPDGIRVIHGPRVHGPFEAAGSTVTLDVGDDAVLTLVDGSTAADPARLFLDGDEVGAGFAQIEAPQLLPGGGFAFVGHDATGHHLVTGAGRSGPWDWIGGRKVSADGARLAFVAGRGREVRREVIAVR